jgi:hypothetical protein
MAEKKWAKNLLASDKENPVFPSHRHKEDPRFIKRIVQLDGDTVPGAEFYSEAKWILPGDRSKEGMVLFDSHTHTWGEFIGFFGFDYENILDLGGEIEFTVDNEKHIITKSFGAFIPAGIQHGPLIIRNVIKPIMHFTGGDTAKYE